jgi:Domain of unknown function (DUF4440)
MKYLLLSIGVVGITIICYGQTSKPINPDEEALVAINRQFIKNFINNDTIEHSKIIHSNFLFIGTDGRLSDRQTYLNGWAHGYDKTVMPEFDLEEVQIRVFGNMALIVAKTRDKSLRNGKWIIGESRYTDTYLKEKGEWKCIQVQMTRMPPIQN